MNLRSQIWLMPHLMLLLACATSVVMPIVSRPAKVERSYNDGLTEDYVKYVEQGRSALRTGHVEAAESSFLDAADSMLLERANYEVWIELAEVKCRLGKTAEARAWLADYGIALRIDLQIETCLEDWGPEMTISPNPRIPLRMYGVMCNAFVQGYGFVDLTDEDRRDLEALYQDLKREASRLEEQCAALSE
jgi:hypothetical protein